MKIALISCVKTKGKSKAMAKDLYLSPWFKMNYAFAKRNYDKVFILSAKYGLLKENDWIEPYEQTLNKMKQLDRRKWANNVLSRLNKVACLQKDKFIILAGIKYREFLLGNGRIENYEIPFEGDSFGIQLKKLKECLYGNV